MPLKRQPKKPSDKNNRTNLAFNLGVSERTRLFYFMENLLILSLSAYRITRLVTGGESGPYNALDRMRDWTGVYIDGDSGLTRGTNELSKAMSCFYCFSIWAGVIVTIISAIPKARRVLIPFAVSGALVIYKEKFNG